jgi:heptosyltransferase I
MNIAIVKLSSLGDIILGMPLLQLIRHQLPDCHITWVSDSRFADILDHQPDIQHVIKLDLKRLKKQFSLSGLAREYRNLTNAGPFDAVIDLHGMIKSAVTATILGGKRFGFDRRTLKEPLSNFLYHRTFPVPLELPAVCRNATLGMQSLGLAFDESDLSGIQPFLFWAEQDLAITDEFFSKERRNIIFVPETSANYKNYPPEKFARIATMLGENILICHGNQQEFETASKISGFSPTVRVLPRLTLNQLKATIGRADLVIGGDSGPTHIAWACGVPSITLFGATPVCICPTPRNRVIKTSSPINHRRHDSSDMSLREIPEEAILHQARELLNLPRQGEI